MALAGVHSRRPAVGASPWQRPEGRLRAPQARQCRHPRRRRRRRRPHRGGSRRRRRRRGRPGGGREGACVGHISLTLSHLHTTLIPNLHPSISLGAFMGSALQACSCVYRIYQVYKATGPHWRRSPVPWTRPGAGAVRRLACGRARRSCPSSPALKPSGVWCRRARHAAV